MGNLLLNVLIIVLARYPVETPPSIIYPSIAIGSPKRRMCNAHPSFFATLMKSTASQANTGSPIG